MSYTNRYIARVTIEAETPMAVGSGEKGINTDRLVVKDANGLPYIPGTALTGVLRHSFNDEDFVSIIFGSGGEDGEGSRLIISSAFLVDKDGKTVLDGLRDIDLSDEYYSFFSRLPERDHVKITHKGVAKKHGKFDEELVHKGTRFVFEIKFLANDTEEDKDVWNKLIKALNSPSYRIGAGTRKGFGRIKIIAQHSKTVSWDLRDEEQLKAYLNKSSSLNHNTSNWKGFVTDENANVFEGWQEFTIRLKAKDFFSFSAGYGDKQADNKPKTERYFDWSNGKPVLIEEDCTLIPASSIKGALSHRVSFHYNLLKERTIGKDVVELTSSLDLNEVERNIRTRLNIDGLNYSSDSLEWESLEKQINSLSIENIEEWEEFKNALNAEVGEKKGATLPVGENNDAVRTLFGYAKDENDGGQRGKVLIEDVYIAPEEITDKVFNHTSIDRFTNATIDGALFQEKVSFYQNQELVIPIWVEEKALQDKTIKDAFIKTLEDLKNGRLALGGSTTKGHGMFQELKK